MVPVLFAPSEPGRVRAQHFHSPCGVKIIIPFYRQGIRTREAKQQSQGHRAGEWPSQGWDTGMTDSKALAAFAAHAF